jgi:hypothetical protein
MVAELRGTISNAPRDLNSLAEQKAIKVPWFFIGKLCFLSVKASMFSSFFQCLPKALV